MNIKRIRNHLAATLAYALVALLLINIAAPTYAADKKPNIVIMLMDNLGYGELGS
jgi:hypothetical protein